MKELMKRIRNFTRERDWEQFHSPKNLSMALSIEASEIMEHFQWKTAEESRKLDSLTLRKVKDEVADTFIYLIRLCDELGIDPIEAAHDKILKNAVKYPVEKFKGSAMKYNGLNDEPYGK
jgi:dCTP diphosphatase